MNPSLLTKIKKRWVWVLLAVVVLSFVSWEVSWQLNPQLPGGWIYTRREHQGRIRFDSEKWKEFSRSRRPTNEWSHTNLRPIRIRMVDDLLKQQDFHRRTREEVEKLLGPKTKTEYFSEWDLVYYLGPGRYGNAVGDSEWLVFRFDSQGRVQDYKIVHD